MSGMMVVRTAIHHLRDGGAITDIPSGRIDPDPALSPDASTTWASGHPARGNAAPCSTNSVLLTVVSGVLSARVRRNPFVRLIGR